MYRLVGAAQALLRAADAADAPAAAGDGDGDGSDEEGGGGRESAEVEAALVDARAAGLPEAAAAAIRGLAKSDGLERERLRLGPKLEALCRLLAETLAADPAARTIVFVHRRAAVGVLCAAIDAHPRTASVARPTPFVGQGARAASSAKARPGCR